MARKDGPKAIIEVDTTQLDEAIAKVQELLDMLYEAANLVHRILQGDETIED